MEILKKNSIILMLTTGLLGLTIGLLPFGIEMEERFGLSWLFSLRGKRPAPTEVVIISLDKESIRGLSLPNDLSKWPRSQYAKLLTKLSHERPAVIAFDVNFKDPSADDPIFANAISAAGNVVLFQQIEREPFSSPNENDPNPINIHIQRIIPPTPQLAQSASALAIFPLPKIPVRVSQYWKFKDGNPELPALPIAAFQIFAKAHHWPAPMPPLPQEKKRSSAYLNFYGPPRTITTIPYSKALELPIPIIVNEKTISLAGKAVFIGLSEVIPDRQTDGFYTVFSQQNGLDISGVEIAGTAFANLLENRPIRPLPFWVWGLVLLVWGLAIGAICSMLPFMLMIGLTVWLPVLYLGSVFFQFKWADTWIPVVIPLLIQLPTAFFGTIFIHYLNAKKTDRLKSEAMVQLSHEIRTPLTATKGYLDNLMDKIAGDLTEKQQTYIGKMNMNMDHLNRMVQDQLNLSQIESGSLHVSLMPVSLTDLLAERVEAMQTIATRKQIQVSLHGFEGTNLVMGDRDKMGQIFTNLLDNAIKFTPTGGTIRITCTTKQKSLEVSIQDSGIGILEKNQKKIFERLHQVQTGQPKQGKGIGLGLFIVRQLVELQRGTIRVKSVSGEGSEFIVAFPLCHSGHT
ncbi:MAG: CHASE2 domain-containing protein [Nitrospirota bacterium]